MNMLRPSFFLCAFALGVTALGTSCEVPGPKPFFCGRVSLTVRDDEPSGDVRLRANLRQDDEEPGDINIAWSTDVSDENPNPTWHIASIEGQTTDLASNEEGIDYELVWQSAHDLGKGTFENVSLRVVGFSECGAWDVEQEDGYTVNNEDAPGDGCTVSVEDVESPVDGPVTVNFTLVHPDSLQIGRASCRERV